MIPRISPDSIPQWGPQDSGPPRDGKRTRTHQLRFPLLLALLSCLVLGACGTGTDSAETSSPDPSKTTSALSAAGALQVLTERYRSVAPNDGLESDSVFFLIPEKKGYELNAPLAIDARDPDTLDESAALIDDSLAAGTRVDSYLLHLDKIGSSSSDVRLKGTVQLPGRLLGLITTGEHLDASDGQLGVSRIQYPDPGSARASEIDRRGDRVVIGPDRQTLTFDLQTTVSADHMRILISSR